MAIKINCERCDDLVEAGKRCETCGLLMYSVQVKVAVSGPLSVAVYTDQEEDQLATVNGTTDKTEKAKKKYKTDDCLECGKHKRIIARGLCGACYPRMKKEGLLDIKYPAKTNPAKKILRLDVPNIEPEDIAVVPIKPEKVVPINSSIPEATDHQKERILVVMSDRDLQLFEQLKTWADDERRSVPDQILHILDKVVPNRLGGAA